MRSWRDRVRCSCRTLEILVCKGEAKPFVSVQAILAQKKRKKLSKKGLLGFSIVDVSASGDASLPYLASRGQKPFVWTLVLAFAFRICRFDYGLCGYYACGCCFNAKGCHCPVSCMRLWASCLHRASAWEPRPEERSDAVQVSRRLNKRAQGAMRTGDMTAALPHLRDAIAVEPYYDLNYNDFGVMLRCLGNTEEAMENFRCAMRLNPAGTDARENLLVAAEELGAVE